MIITIDGSSASGKGTISRRLATKYNFAYLDTGALYRLTAYKVLQTNVDITDQVKVAEIALALSIDDVMGVGDEIRKEEVSKAASVVASYPQVRANLLDLQRNFTNLENSNYKGIIFDGRDTGTVICPDADVKVFIDLPVEVRAERRFKQLQEENIEGSQTLDDVLQAMIDRDKRDSERDVAPMKAAPDAHIIKDPGLSIEQEVNLISHLIDAKLK